MPNQFLNEIGTPDVTDVASRGSTAEQELVAAAKRGDEGAFETSALEWWYASFSGGKVSFSRISLCVNNSSR